MGAGESNIISSSETEDEGVDMGVGEVTSMIAEQNGILCGKGDISMSSVKGAGEDGGKGGVVTYSAQN